MEEQMEQQMEQNVLPEEGGGRAQPETGAAPQTPTGWQRSCQEAAKLTPLVLAVVVAGRRRSSPAAVC